MINKNNSFKKEVEAIQKMQLSDKYQKSAKFLAFSF